MILSRLIALEREQIGLLKALGYGRLEVVWHYLKLVLVIAAVGILIGSVAGTWLGRGMTVQYAKFYSFPFLIFRMSPQVYLDRGRGQPRRRDARRLRLGARRLRAARGGGDAPAGAADLSPRCSTGPSSGSSSSRSSPPWRIRHLIRHPVRSGLTAVGTASRSAWSRWRWAPSPRSTS